MSRRIALITGVDVCQHEIDAYLRHVDPTDEIASEDFGCDVSVCDPLADLVEAV